VDLATGYNFPVFFLGVKFIASALRSIAACVVGVEVYIRIEERLERGKDLEVGELRISLDSGRAWLEAKRWIYLFLLKMRSTCL